MSLRTSLNVLSTRFTNEEICQSIQALVTFGLNSMEISNIMEQIASVASTINVPLGDVIERLIKAAKRRDERGYRRTHMHTGHDYGVHEKTTPRPPISIWDAQEDLRQVLNPINVWKDDERDETIYTPRIQSVLSGPVSSVIASGEVLFQSRRYVNPVILHVQDL